MPCLLESLRSDGLIRVAQEDSVERLGGWLHLFNASRWLSVPGREASLDEELLDRRSRHARLRLALRIARRRMATVTATNKTGARSLRNTNSAVPNGSYFPQRNTPLNRIAELVPAFLPGLSIVVRTGFPLSYDVTLHGRIQYGAFSRNKPHVRRFALSIIESTLSSLLTSNFLAKRSAHLSSFFQSSFTRTFGASRGSDQSIYRVLSLTMSPL